MATLDPRKRNIVQMTLKMKNNVSQAPPRCEPWKRERRPSRFGEFFTRMAPNAMMPSRPMTAMKSCAKPSTPQWPTTGIAQPSWNREPYASR